MSLSKTQLGHGPGCSFSLGGNQGKFALACIGDGCFEPNGRAVSTHIVKPGMVIDSGSTNAAVQAVEFVTMRAARLLGVPAATVEIHDFAGIQAFATNRYDRRTRSDGSVQGIHQEDFRQALSALPARKYEEDGGPTMADMVRLVCDACPIAYDPSRAISSVGSLPLISRGMLRPGLHPQSVSTVLAAELISGCRVNGSATLCAADTIGVAPRNPRSPRNGSRRPMDEQVNYP